MGRRTEGHESIPRCLPREVGLRFVRVSKVQICAAVGVEHRPIMIGHGFTTGANAWSSWHEKCSGLSGNFGKEEISSPDHRVVKRVFAKKAPRQDNQAFAPHFAPNVEPTRRETWACVWVRHVQFSSHKSKPSPLVLSTCRVLNDSSQITNISPIFSVTSRVVSVFSYFSIRLGDGW